MAGLSHRVSAGRSCAELHSYPIGGNERSWKGEDCDSFPTTALSRVWTLSFVKEQNERSTRLLWHTATGKDTYIEGKMWERENREGDHRSGETHRIRGSRVDTNAHQVTPQRTADHRH